MLQSKHIRKYKFILMDNSKDEAPTASASEPSRITSISSRIASIKRKRQQQRDCPLVIPEQRRSYRIRYIPKKKAFGSCLRALRFKRRSRGYCYTEKSNRYRKIGWQYHQKTDCKWTNSSQKIELVNQWGELHSKAKLNLSYHSYYCCFECVSKTKL